MKYKKLGKTDMSVSEVCLGTMTWGCQNTEPQAHEQMDYAVEQGVNFFDTAELYAVPPEEHTQGLTETYIGNWFAKTGKRKDIILASKIAGVGLPWIDNGDPISPNRIELAIERSLKRLQTDYIDLYQLHWPNYKFPHFGNHHAGDIDHTEMDSEQEIEGMLNILQALDKAVKAGKIRAFGLSNDSSWGVMKYLELARKHNLTELTSIQNEYSIMYRGDEPYMAETCVHENVSYLTYSSLVCGAISGKYLEGARPQGTRWKIEKDMGRNNQRDVNHSQDAIRAYMSVAEKHGLDVCQMALAFCYQRPFVTSVIIGATTMEQLKSNIDAKNIVLSADVLNDIDTVNRQYPVPY
jgi:aryl-alcohol dehydrogenase-like predicted oxidoreductase